MGRRVAKACVGGVRKAPIPPCTAGGKTIRDASKANGAQKRESSILMGDVNLGKRVTMTT